MRRTAIALALLAAGCATTAPAVREGVKIRPDTRVQCEANCNELGMKLGSIVLIQNSAGCVCEPYEPPSRPTSSRTNAGAAAAAGGAMIVAAAEEEDRREQRRREDEEQRRREEEERQRREDEQRRQQQN